MIDLHCHILPGVDDGAPSLEVSRRMLEAARAMGFRTVVATPHLAGPLDAAYDAQVIDAFAEVLPIAQELGIYLLPGFEVRLTPDLADRLADGERATLANSRAVLVDLPMLDIPPYAERALFALQTAGYQPILAHPERYPDVQRHPELGKELAARGIALQITMSSLTGVFGKPARRAAEALLRLGAVHLVATDAHSDGQRLSTVPAGLRRLRTLLGEDQCRRALIDNPHALIAGEALPLPLAVSGRGLRVPFLRR